MANPELAIQVKAIVDDYLKNMKKAEQETDKLKKKQNEAAKSSGKMGGAVNKLKMGLLATVGVIYGVIRGITKLLNKFTDYALKIDKASKATGVAREELQKWGYIAEQEHGNFERIERAFLTISTRAVQSSQGLATYTREFEEMGINIYDTSGNIKAADKIFLEMGDYIKNASDETAALGHVSNLLGLRMSKDLIPMLKLSNEEIEKLKQEAESLGIVLDTATIKATKVFTDELTKAKKGFEGVVFQLGAALLPVLNQLPGLLTTIVPFFKRVMGLVGRLLERIIPFLQELLDVIMPFLIKILDAVEPILMNIIDAVLPIIIDLLNIMLPIIEALLPLIELLVIPLQIVAEVLKILHPILEAITPALETVADTIAKVVNWITQGIDQLKRFLGLSNALQSGGTATGFLESATTRFGPQGEVLPGGSDGGTVTGTDSEGNIVQSGPYKGMTVDDALWWANRQEQDIIDQLDKDSEGTRTAHFAGLIMSEEEIEAYEERRQKLLDGWEKARNQAQGIVNSIQSVFGGLGEMILDKLKITLDKGAGLFQQFGAKVWNSLLDLANRIITSALINLAVQLIASLIPGGQSVAALGGIGGILLQGIRGALGFDNPKADFGAFRSGFDVMKNVLNGMNLAAQGAQPSLAAASSLGNVQVNIHQHGGIGTLIDRVEYDSTQDEKRRFGRTVKTSIKVADGER